MEGEDTVGVGAVADSGAGSTVDTSVGDSNTGAGSIGDAGAPPNAGAGAGDAGPAGPGEPASNSPGPVSSPPEGDGEANEGPTFDWEAWDGSDESLPEDARFWASGVRSYLTKSYEQRIADAERAQRTYDAILQGMEDPRLQELEEKVASGEATMAETRQALEAKEAAYTALETAHNELIEAQAQAEVESFKSAFGDILKDKANREKLGTLMDEDIFSSASLEDLGNLVTMGEEDIAAVRDVMNEENVSARFAIRFVKSTRAQQADPAPPASPVPANPAKRIVAGASKGGRPAKAVSGANKRKAANLEEAKLQIARKYFR